MALDFLGGIVERCGKGMREEAVESCRKGDQRKGNLGGKSSSDLAGLLTDLPYRAIFICTRLSPLSVAIDSPTAVIHSSLSYLIRSEVVVGVANANDGEAEN